MALGQVNVPGAAGMDAVEAKQAAQAAKEAAEAAQRTAESAGKTADAAMQKAADAETAAGNADSKADAALDAANNAAGAATAAASAASAAEESANSANTAANEAKTAASNAQKAANDALKAVTKLTSVVNSVPTQAGILTYTGAAQSPSWNGYDTEKLTIGGTTSGTNAGSYVATFTPKEGYEWADGTKTAKSVTWTISKASLSDTSLANNTPDIIAAAAKSGQAANYWSVGDKVGIAVNGSFGGLSYNNTVYAFILGFNHNSSVEGGNSIHFQFGKTAAGVDIAFVNSYGSTSTGFCMNTSNTNSGGWNNSYMRKTICPAFLAALPTAWQNIIAACTKYSDNTGGGSNTASYVTATSDKIWLLSEMEVQGTRSYANSAEANYQKQYDYYRNGNSKVKYQHTATTSACYWWLRSVHASNTNNFCIVSTGGSANVNGAYYSNGFAPGFKVA